MDNKKKKIKKEHKHLSEKTVNILGLFITCLILYGDYSLLYFLL